MVGHSFKSTEKKLHSVEFYQSPARQQFWNGERSNVVVQSKAYVDFITPTWTTPKSAKQPLQITNPSTKKIKDRLKNLSPIRLEKL